MGREKAFRKRNINEKTSEFNLREDTRRKIYQLI